jgi:hypothetical protein
VASSQPVYRHTQVAWLLVVFAGAMTLALLAGSRDIASPGALAPIFLLLGVPLTLYGTLTVRVDREALHLSYGLGFVSRRIPLSQIRGWREVRTRLRNGIGVRLIRGGTLYNVALGPAVELLLGPDRVVWIGTPEPGRLMEALAGMHAPAVPDYPAVVATVRRRRRGQVVPVVAALVLLVVAWNVWRASIQPDVSVSPAAIVISTPLYHERIPVSLLTAVSLEESFPNLRRRVESLLSGDSVRGRFLLEGTGSALIFADRDRPPFIHLRTNADYAIIGFRDAARTRALYDQILRVRGAP